MASVFLHLSKDFCSWKLMTAISNYEDKFFLKISYASCISQLDYLSLIKQDKIFGALKIQARKVMAYWAIL